MNYVISEAERCFGCKNPQCSKGCPIGTPIPEVIRLFRENRLNEAGQILFDNNPLRFRQKLKIYIKLYMIDIFNNEFRCFVIHSVPSRRKLILCITGTSLLFIIR